MNYNGMGVYTAHTQFDFDPVKLQALGFSPMEIDTLQYIILNGGKVTNQALTSYGLTYEQAKKIRYMYDICTGKFVIEDPSMSDTLDDLAKHAKKMFGHVRRLSIHDLATTKVNKVPRTALIAGIPDGPFSILNSKKYPPLERMYTVEDVRGSRVTIETDRIPVLKYKQQKFIEGILEIKEGPKNGKIKIAIDKNYCRLCNRFVIVASLRRPEFHLGMVEMVCIEGSKLYVFAKDIGTAINVGYRMNTQRIYSYGFYPSEIQSKLMICATELYNNLLGIYARVIPANQDFIILTPEREEETDEIEID